MAELFDVISACGFVAHSYADDTQVYISTSASDHSDAMRHLSDCITLIHDWMTNNRLKLNEDKTQVIWLGTCQQLSKITAQSLTLPNATVQFTNNANDLGVLLDSQLTMADHICTQPVLLLSAPSAQVDQTVTDAGRRRRHLFMHLLAADSTIATVC